MNIYISGDADDAGKLVGRARLADDAVTMRKLSHSLESGNDIFKKWAEGHGGNMVEQGGDEFCCEVPADALEELHAIKEQYEELVGATLSIGVGMRISESAKALMYRKLKGKNGISFYNEEMEKTIEEARKHQPSELDKLQDEYLEKADAPVAATQPSAPSVQAPVATQGDHEEGQDMYNLLDEERPPAPEMTSAAKSFEDQLHDEAFKGEESDMASKAQKTQGVDAIKQQVSQALQSLKAQAPILAQLKQAAPEAYQAMMGLSLAVVAMAKELAGPDPESRDPLATPMPTAMAKAEGEGPVSLVHYSRKAGLKKIDTKHMGTGAPSSEYRQGLPEVERAYYYRAGSTPEPLVTQGAKGVYGATLDPKKHRLYDLGTDLEGLRAPAREKFLAGEGLGSPDDTFLQDVKDRGYHGYHNSASAMPHVVALFHPHPVSPMKKEELESHETKPLDKAGLPMPEVAAHHHTVLPSGSVVDQRVKVTHLDGTQGWRQVGSGMILGQDPAHHPVSSRDPNSR